MEKNEIIKSIGSRTNGDIYLGVVGAVRTGKSTFIKKFIETLVLPNIEDEYEKKRCLDEMPQSAQGKTIMTTEPKFVPSNAAKINIEDFNKLEKDHSIIKIMMIDEEEVLQKAIDNLPKEVYDKYTVVRSAPYFLEFLNKEVNKGVGVEMLAKHMGITLDQVITMGDAGNDLHMIECAGMGVAMGNAFEEIKEVANYITDTNENDGVAKAIEHLVLNS